MRRLRLGRQSLTTKFIVGVLCALLPIAGLLSILWQQRRERDLRAALSSLTQTGDAIALIADDALDEGVKFALTVATGTRIQSLDPAVFNARLAELLAIHPGYASLLIADGSGAVLGWVGDEPAATKALSPAEREVLDRVVRGRAPTLFVVPEPALPDQIAAGVIAPISGPDGAATGAIVARFDLRAIGERLRELRTYQDQGLALIDNTGRLVVAVSPTGALSDGLTWEQRSRAEAPEVQAARNGQVAFSRTFVSPILHDERLSVWMPTRKHGWIASANWPVEAALAESRAAERNEILIFATIGLVLVFSAAIAARAVVRPLQRLAEHAARLGDGDFAPVRGIRGDDEIGQLAGAFSRMGQRLHQTLVDLDGERAQLESILRQLPVGVVVASAEDGRVLRVNTIGEWFLSRTATRSGTYDPNEPSLAFHLDGRPIESHERQLGRALRNGETVRGEELLLRLPGESDIVLSVNATPIRDSEGRVISAVQTFEDVTERRLTEIRLRQQDQFLRTLFEQFPGTLGVMDRDFRCILAVSTEQYPGAAVPSVEGRTLDEFLPPERAEAARERVRRALDGETVTVEESFGDRVFTVILCPLRDPDGSIPQVLSLRFDITEERHTAATLRDREILLQVLVDQFPAAINIVDRELRVMMAGGVRALGTGLPADTLTGRSMADILRPVELESYRRATERVFNGETVSTETHFRDRVLRATMTPLRNADGVIDKVLNVAFDVTDEVARLERDVRDEKLRALGQMAGGIAHDLNQALTLISGYGELAREELHAAGPDPDVVTDMIRIMERAAYDGGSMVKRLLTFARGGEDEQLQPVDVDVLLHEVEQLTAPRWRDASRAEGRRVVLRVRSRSGLSVLGSQGALREMLTNLVFNALDAMPEGGTITLAADREDDRVTIQVADTGHGMTPEVKARVFEPFFTTKGSRGTGLGMAMVYGIVERHHGQVDIATEVGHGTTIYLTFPLQEAARAEAPDAVAPGPVRQRRILVVDDEVRLAALLVGMLRHEGHEGVTTASAEEALVWLRRESFDLVISDLSMGDGMNGWELAGAIAAFDRPIPIILATGWGASIDEADARSRGVSGVVAKPYRRADLRRIIAQVLGE